MRTVERSSIEIACISGYFDLQRSTQTKREFIPFTNKRLAFIRPGSQVVWDLVRYVLAQTCEISRRREETLIAGQASFKTSQRIRGASAVQNGVRLKVRAAHIGDRPEHRIEVRLNPARRYRRHETVQAERLRCGASAVQCAYSRGLSASAFAMECMNRRISVRRVF
jgi:hypothetical protein